MKNRGILNRWMSGGFCRLLTVLKQHVDRVERCPADGEQQNNGDHHFNGSFLFPVSNKIYHIFRLTPGHLFPSKIYINTYILIG